MEECSSDGVVETGCEGGCGYCLPPFGTAYRSSLRTTRTRCTTRGYGSTVDYPELFLVQSLLGVVIVLVQNLPGAVNSRESDYCHQAVFGFDVSCHQNNPAEATKRGFDILPLANSQA